MKQNKQVVILYGPTGVGKSDTALALADRLNGEIINMDMGALYAPLTIGTAKPDWRASTIPHHLFDIIETPRNVTVIEYRSLVVRTLGEIWKRGNGYVAEKSPAAARGTRIPSGHPEAFLEAFANIYRNATDAMRAQILREKPDPLALDFPSVDDGLRGMLFIETVVKSAASKQKWVPMPKG